MKIDIAQLEFIDSKLRNILVWIEKETGFEFTITSLYRINDSGVHGTLPLRGADLRMRNVEAGAVIEKLINDNWVYNPDSKKNCTLLHGSGSNLHLHVQVHPETRKRVV
jgi:hypothetical protein